MSKDGAGFDGISLYYYGDVLYLGVHRIEGKWVFWYYI